MPKQFLKHLARLYLPVFQYETDTMKILYAGYSHIKRNYFVRFLLDCNPDQVYIGRRWFWKLPELVNSDIDIVVSEVSRMSLSRFQNYKGYILPEWVPMRINISRPLEEICRGSVSHFSDIKKRIRKYNLTYEVLSDKESFDYFIERIYHPFISKRHGEEALIEDLQPITESSASFLIAVKENGIIVAGALLKRLGDSLSGLRLGILDGNEEYRRHGVIGAIYYFSILEGQKMGYRFLDVGGTRPFISDHLTCYKLGLSAEFSLDHTPWKEYMWLGVNKHSVGAGEFMKNNPFVYLNNDNTLGKYMT